MTNIQVQYWKYQEDARHNRAAETEVTKSREETIRHNKVTEGETTRHNLATEAESQRHNLQTEYWTGFSEQEKQRHNLTTEAEASRHNLATEKVDAAKVAESTRHNLVTEANDAQRNAETQRHNIATEHNSVGSWLYDESQGTGAIGNKLHEALDKSDAQNIVDVASYYDGLPTPVREDLVRGVTPVRSATTGAVVYYLARSGKHVTLTDTSLIYDGKEYPID